MVKASGASTLPDSFKNLNLVGVDISDNNFDQFPYVLCEMVNDGNLRNITVDNMQTLLNTSNTLKKIQNKYNRSYVNIFLNCFVDAHCFSDKDLDYLNNTFPAIHFSTNWTRVRRFNQ